MALINTAVSIGVVAMLAGCGMFGSERLSDEGSPAEHAALEAFFEDPLYVAEPPSTGQIVEEVEEDKCREHSHEPGASRTYVLLSDGQDVANFYRARAAEHGWRLVEENAIDPDAPFAGRRASLFFERPEGEFTIRLWIGFGLGLGSRTPTVSVGGGVVDASFCS